MAERGQNVLHIPRSDDEGAPVLLQIVPAPSASASRPLDARLVGTEGEAPYVLSRKSVCLPCFRPAQIRPCGAPPGCRAAARCPASLAVCDSRAG